MIKPKNLELLVLSDCFAVCRFPPDAAVPSWATPASAAFVSITRTAEELSIVCPQEWLPSGTTSTQRDWTCYKIQGPLDFSWTGILASLANPLSDAGISIFAISTYDTDYILVKRDKAEDATAVLQQQGHTVTYEANNQNETPTTIIEPMDGPATEFVADPFVASLVETSTRKPTPASFGLVVVAGWPPEREQWMRNYAEFCAAVQLCFDEPDVHVPFGSEGSPAVYLYPFPALHTTIATFRPFTLSGDDLTEQQKDLMITNWTRVVERAARSDLWPKGSLRLEVESAQLGAKAGILLWKETTGGLRVIRTCMGKAFQDFLDEFPEETASMSTFTIPSVIHSTFCRFHKVPLSKCDTVQERFQRDVVPNLSSIFPLSIEISSVSLVCERTPYMHVPNDKKHVLFHLELK